MHSPDSPDAAGTHDGTGCFTTAEDASDTTADIIAFRLRAVAVGEQSDFSTPLCASSRPKRPGRTTQNGRRLRSRVASQATATTAEAPTPKCDNAGDSDQTLLHHPVVLQARAEIAERLSSGILPRGSWGEKSNRATLKLIDAMRPAVLGTSTLASSRSSSSPSSTCDDTPGVDALHLTSTAARELVRTGTPPVPVICTGDDQTGGPCPSLAEFLALQRRLDRPISVQDPGLTGAHSARSIPLRELVARLSAASLDPASAPAAPPPPLPLNALDFPVALTAWNLHPAFLSVPNATLLHDARALLCSPRGVARQAAPSREAAAWWTQKELWALVSEGGTCTLPHTDATGYATWIRVREGSVVFAWLSRAWAGEDGEEGEGEEEEDKVEDESWMWGDGWVECAEVAVVGRWRYVVLGPGDTVFFPTRTVHAVFRPAEGGPTFALGGHVLLWSGVVDWMRALTWQFAREAATNEDDETELTWEVVRAVKELVRDQVEEAGECADLIGGKEGRKEFEEAYEVFQLVENPWRTRC